MIVLQFDLFEGPQQIIVASGGAIHPDRRRLSGKLPRRRKRRNADQEDQLELPLGEPGGASTPDHQSIITTPAQRRTQHD